MDNTDPFDSFHAEYDIWFDENTEVFLAELDLLKNVCASETPKLEIGVGTGRFALPLGIEYGLEPSSNMAQYALRRGICTVRGYAGDIPFADGSFGAVYMITVLCFIENPMKALEEVRRVLSERGCLIIGFVDKDSGLGQKYLAKKEKSRFYRNAHFYSADEVIEMLGKFGFTGISISGISDEAFGSGYYFTVIKAEK
ncbi:class I SAM-dependent methyltransferase [Seleniivibrio woodruffii]|uniref:Methyltransferase family protein n=1 Tax=Seleniivibrio woodruffii TaxID=1078050 RepID=A0A4V2PRC9_9BACT|nr:class I SAM-dependent methyltransferase [Seleniivibrio woodruffii]TCK58411.1 methyltransferase family protein [Seleniivibrio woodruffii]TVZ36784.1 methyltransferase family protein [Seleniivibrio woodruffii]